MSDPIEAVYYVHGVSNDIDGRFHDAEYLKLHNGVLSRNPQIPSSFEGAEWGWQVPGAPNTPDQLLTPAQEMLGERALKAVKEEADWTMNPARLVINQTRGLLMYGFGDIFYYTSANGKSAIRQTVGTHICKYIKQLRGDETDGLVSLTLAGHSAGSMILFDLLFYLFYGSEHQFLDPSQPCVRDDAISELAELRADAQAGRIRVKRLFTFGSPITPLAVRSNAVLEILASGGRLDVSDYGLDQNPDGFPEVSGPRWVNVWDKDDAIAWPAEPLMNDHGQGIVEDVYVDVSDAVTSVHNRYWDSSRVHKAFANRW